MPASSIKAYGQIHTYSDANLQREFANIYRMLQVNRLKQGNLDLVDVARGLRPKLDRLLGTTQLRDDFDGLFHNVKVYGAAGDGTTSDVTNIGKAVTAAGSTGTVYFPPSDYVIDANTSLTCFCWFAPGATLSISDGVQVTFPSADHIMALDAQQIFDDANQQNDGVVFTSPGRMSTGWWGAADGDDIKHAWSACMYAVNGADGGTIFIPPGDYTWSAYTTSPYTERNFPTTPYNYMFTADKGTLISGVGARITYAASAIGSREDFLKLYSADNYIIEGLYVDGNVDAVGRGTGTGGSKIISVASSSNVTIRDVHLKDAQLDCLSITYNDSDVVSQRGRVSNCTFENGSRDCVTLAHARDWVFDSCIIKDAASDSTARQANFVCLAFEIHQADHEVENITFNSCEILACNWGSSLRATNGNAATRNIVFNGCNIETDPDGGGASYGTDPVIPAGACGAVSLESYGQGFTFNGCRFYGNVSVEGQADFRGCKFYIDSSIDNTYSSVARQALRFNDGALGCSVRDCKFELATGAYNPRFVVFENRSGNSDGETFIFENNKFITNGASLTGGNFFDLGTYHTDDRFYFSHNRFRHAGTSPSSPYYCNVQPDGNAMNAIMGPGNFGDPDLQIGDSTYYAWGREMDSANNGGVIRRYWTKSLSGSSVTLSSAIYADCILLGICVTIKTDIVMGGGGTTLWVGNTGDDDRWGATSTLTAGTTLWAEDWTNLPTDNPPIFFSSASDIVFKPNTGTFTSGEVEVQLIYIRYQF